jgi:hypothetical protein
VKLLSKNNITIYLTIFSLAFTENIQCQFAPAAGQPGTTAIHMDSSSFVAWASDCNVNLGTEDISNSQSNIVSTGNYTMAIGQPGSGVVSLGDGGSAILTFERNITNGAGWDFAVFENSFSDDFLELGYVEVSSNGIDFIRFSAISNTQDTLQIDAFGSLDPEKINNLAGKYRATFGTPFDLEELSNEPLLDINAISHVKIIDVIGSIDNSYCNFDSDNNKINDPWPTPFPSSGFDLDAIGVIHEAPLSINSYKNEFVKNITVENQTISFDISISVKEKSTWTIANLNGQIVHQRQNFLINKSRNFINIGYLKSGIYFLNINNRRFVKTFKILIP